MSLSIFSIQAQEHDYRARTASDKSTAGVTLPSFRCTRCGQSRRINGRKKIGKGYVCAGCLEPQQPPSEALAT